jgi:hypothetical protein
MKTLELKKRLMQLAGVGVILDILVSFIGAIFIGPRRQLAACVFGIASLVGASFLAVTLLELHQWWGTSVPLLSRIRANPHLGARWAGYCLMLSGLLYTFSFVLVAAVVLLIAVWQALRFAEL